MKTVFALILTTLLSPFSLVTSANAQECGWYAIYNCSRSWQDARGVAAEYGGRVIDSSHPDFPNFRPGWYCTAFGPMGKGAAQAKAARARRDGYSTAYVKNAC